MGRGGRLRPAELDGAADGVGLEVHGRKCGHIRIDSPVPAAPLQRLKFRYDADGLPSALGRSRSSLPVRWLVNSCDPLRSPIPSAKWCEGAMASNGLAAAPA